MLSYPTTAEQLLTHEEEWIREFIKVILKHDINYDFSIASDPNLTMGDVINARNRLAILIELGEKFLILGSYIDPLDCRIYCIATSNDILAVSFYWKTKRYDNLNETIKKIKELLKVQ